MRKQCKKCNKIWEVVDGRNRAKQPSLYCKSCPAKYNKMGISLVDNYLLEALPYYNPSGPYILKCECGVEQTYTSKYSLVRVLEGTGKSKQRSLWEGKCGKCSKAMKRDWSNTVRDNTISSSLEYSDRRSLQSSNRYYGTSFDTFGEFNIWYKNNIKGNKKAYKRYCNRISTRSIRNLKLYKPQEYEKWSNNKWNGTDMNQLTIDHEKEKWECYSDGWTVAQASHINNLSVVSMRENIEKHENYKKRNERK
jgi:hypothetical protein